MNQCRFAGLVARCFEDGHAAGQVSRAHMNMHRRPMRERLLFGAQNPNPRVDLAHGFGHVSGNDPVAAGNRTTPETGTDQVERAPVSGFTRVGRRVLRVYRAHTRSQPGGRRPDPVPDGNRSGQTRSRDDEARPGQGKASIHRETKISGDIPRPMIERGPLQMFSKRINSFAGKRG